MHSASTPEIHFSVFQYNENSNIRVCARMQTKKLCKQRENNIFVANSTRTRECVWLFGMQCKLFDRRGFWGSVSSCQGAVGHTTTRYRFRYKEKHTGQPKKWITRTSCGMVCGLNLELGHLQKQFEFSIGSRHLEPSLVYVCFDVVGSRVCTTIRGTNKLNKSA